MTFPATPQSVSVPSEFIKYVAFMHDVIAGYHQILIRITSPDEASRLMAQIADSAIVQLGLSKEMDPKTAADAFLRALGMKFRVSRVGEKTVVTLACPYATMIHPKLAQGHHLCPASLIVLGAERLGSKDRVMVETHLSHAGSEYTIAKSD